MNRTSKETNEFQLQPVSITLVDLVKEEQENPFNKLRKISINTSNELFEDDQFKLPEDKLPKGVVVRRISTLFGHDQSIYQPQQHRRQVIVNHHNPTYLAQMQIIPDWHYLSLIEPRVVSSRGFYYVAVVQDGRMTKIIIDDYIYYDQINKQIYSHLLMQRQPLSAHIILKAWAKINKGYHRLHSSQPFSFIQAFTYPDWSILNPQLQSLQTVISKLGYLNQNEYFYVAKTKSDPNVGLYGLIPNCASYVISGYYQEYENVFLKVRSFVGDKWNGCSQEKDIDLPTDPILLTQGQFVIPLKVFINIFHLIYFTTKKYSRKQRLFYDEYTVNLDARQSKASFIQFVVEGQNLVERSVNINLYLPSVQGSDFVNSNGQRRSMVPSCKISMGRVVEKLNHEGSISYAQSLKQTILKNQQSYLLKHTQSRYEHVLSDYFKGYANQTTYHLKLKPAKYIIRLKIQKLLPQYRAIINFTSNQELSLAQLKINKQQQMQFLSQILSNKGRKQQKNLIHPFPHRKQSWIMANYDFQAIGYGAIIIQTGKNDNYIITVTIDPIKLRGGGYRLKNKVELMGVQKQMRLRQGESKIIILKKDMEYKGEYKWPPQGIYISYQPIQYHRQSS